MPPTAPKPQTPTRRADQPGNTARRIELAAVFVLLPAAIACSPWRVPVIPLMLGLAVGAWVWLRRDPSFDRRQLGRGIAATRRDVLWVLGRFIVLAGVLAAALWAVLGQERWGLRFPRQVFVLPRQRPGLWAFIMVAYPVASVLPQNVLWRAFFFHRYRGQLGTGPGMVAASALAFGWAHIVMLNWFAVATTLVGGVFFAQTYRRTGSLLLASAEHALYGAWMFTVGYGLLFLYGQLPPEALEMMNPAAPTPIR